jgi:hypothetical protein
MAGVRVAVRSTDREPPLETGWQAVHVSFDCRTARHLWVTYRFSSHNAFRAPGAAAIDDVRRGQRKVTCVKGQYARMQRGILEHAYDLSAGNAELLTDMSFVFVSIEGGEVKRELVTALESLEARSSTAASAFDS